MFTATTAQKTKLGLFLLVAGGLLAAILLLFVGLNLMRQPDRYYVRTGESVSGLRVGAPVEVRGVAVGQVADIALERGTREPVTITLEVESGTPIPKDAAAVLRMKGVTGLQYVDVDAGNFSGPLREPGDDIPSAPSMLSKISDQGVALVQSSRELVQSGKQLVDRLGVVVDDENRARIDQILARGERAMGSLERAAAQMERTGARLEELVGGEGRRTVEAAGALVGDARRMVQGSRTQIGDMVGDLREAARSLRRTAQSLERDPSRLLFRRRVGERENP